MLCKWPTKMDYSKYYTNSFREEIIRACEDGKCKKKILFRGNLYWARNERGLQTESSVRMRIHINLEHNWGLKGQFCLFEVGLSEVLADNQCTTCSRMQPARSQFGENGDRPRQASRAVCWVGTRSQAKKNKKNASILLTWRNPSLHKPCLRC